MVLGNATVIRLIQLLIVRINKRYEKRYLDRVQNKHRQMLYIMYSFMYY